MSEHDVSAIRSTDPGAPELESKRTAVETGGVAGRNELAATPARKPGERPTGSVWKPERGQEARAGAGPKGRAPENADGMFGATAPKSARARMLGTVDVAGVAKAAVDALLDDDDDGDGEDGTLPQSAAARRRMASGKGKGSDGPNSDTAADMHMGGVKGSSEASKTKLGSAGNPEGATAKAPSKTIKGASDPVAKSVKPGRGSAEAMQAARNMKKSMEIQGTVAAKGTVASTGSAKGFAAAAVTSPAGVVVLLAVAACIAFVLFATVVSGAGGGAEEAGDGTSIVEVARAEYDRGVSDGTMNSGGRKYWSWNGWPSRVEWCVCFVEWCANECGYVESGLFPARGTSHCAMVIAHFGDASKGTIHRNDGSYVPQAGDLALNGTSHIGIVEKSNENGTFTTIEGNSPDKTGNWAYTAGGSGWTMFITPAYPATATGSGEIMDGVDFSMTEEAFVSKWAPRIDKFYEGYNVKAGGKVPLSGYGESFARSAYRHKVDPRLSPAIAINESGGGRVCWLKYGAYDAWGWGAYFPAANWPDAIEMHLRGLEAGYKDIRDVGAFAHKYAAGEPESNIQMWANHLREYMASM